ncbi:hypothetical protein KEM55_000570, partial [Ascosphaera atra]
MRDELVIRATTHGFNSPSAAANSAASASDPAANAGSDVSPMTEVHTREDKVVLTLYGNAPRGAQMFSSLRQSDKQTGKIKEEELPSGISVSQVIPFNPALEAGEKKRTLGEVFPPKPNALPLEPPKRRLPPARATVPWIDPYQSYVESCIPFEERTGYLYYPVSSGQWLQYDYQSVVHDALQKTQSSQTRKTGRLRRGPFANNMRAVDPMFAQAYSSFGPSYESSGASVGRE